MIHLCLHIRPMFVFVVRILNNLILNYDISITLYWKSPKAVSDQFKVHILVGKKHGWFFFIGTFLAL